MREGVGLLVLEQGRRRGGAGLLCERREKHIEALEMESEERGEKVLALPVKLKPC